MTLNDLMDVGVKAEMFTFHGIKLRIRDISLSVRIIGRSMNEDYTQTLVTATFDMLDMPYATIEVEDCPSEVFVRDWLSELSVI